MASKDRFLRSLRFSLDGQRVFALGGEPVPENPGRQRQVVWEVIGGITLGTWPATDILPQACCLGADGKTLVTKEAHNSESVVVWDIDGARPRLQLGGHKGSVQAFALSPDASRLITAGDYNDKTAKLWDAQTGQQLQTFSLENGPQAVAIAPDLQTVLTLAPQQLILWNVNTAEKRIAVETNVLVQRVSFSSSGRLIIGAGSDGNAGVTVVWDAATGGELRRFRQDRYVNAADVRADDRYLVASSHRSACVWDVATGEELAHIWFPRPKTSDWLVTTPQGLFDGSEPGRSAVFYRIGEGAAVEPLPVQAARDHCPGLLSDLLQGLRPVPTPVPGPDKAPQVRLVASEPAKTDKVRRVAVDVTDRGAGVNGPWLWHNMARLQPDAAPPSADAPNRWWFTVRLSVGSNRLEAHASTRDRQWYAQPAVLTIDRELAVEEVPLKPAPSAGPELVLQTGHSDTVKALALSPDNTLLVTGSRDQTAIVWDLATGQQLFTLRGHQDDVIDMAFGTDGDDVITAAEDGLVILWDLSTGRARRQFRHQSVYQIQSIAWAAGGKQIIAADSNSACIWDRETGKTLKYWESKEYNDFVRLSPDGRWLLAGDERPTSVWRLLEAATGKPLDLLPGMPPGLGAAAFTPDGKLLLAGQDKDEGQAVLWDLQERRPLRTITPSPRCEAAAISGDGRRFVIGSYYRSSLWDTATGTKSRDLTAHGSDVDIVAISNDGRVVLTACRFDKHACVWDARSGLLQRMLVGHRDDIEVASLSFDGQFALTGSGDHSVILWDTATGKARHRLAGHGGELDQVVFSADGRTALTSDKEGLSITWDVAAGSVKARMRAKGAHRPAQLSPDGQFVATSPDTADASGTIWDANTGQPLARLRPERKNWPDDTAFAADGRFFFTAGSGGKFNELVQWDVSTGRTLRVLEATRNVDRMAVAPDGQHAVTIDREGEAILWDVARGTALRQLPTDASSALFAPSGRQVLTLPDLGKHEAVLWAVPSGEMLRVFHGDIESATFTVDGQKLLLGRQKSADLWELDTGMNVSIFQASAGINELVAISQDGRHVLTSDGEPQRAAVLWDADSGQQRRIFRGHIAPVDAVAISPDGRTVLTGSGGGYNRPGPAWIWDTVTGRLVRQLPGHLSTIKGATFSFDSRQILTVERHKYANLWDAGSGRRLRRLEIQIEEEGEDLALECASFSRDGRQVIVGGGCRNRPGLVLFMDTDTGQIQRTLRGHNGEIRAVAQSPDGRWLATAGHYEDLTILIWDLAKGQPVHKLSFKKGHSIGQLVFSPDSRSLAALGTRAHLYDVETGQERVLLDPSRTLVMGITGNFSPDGRFLVVGDENDPPAVLLLDTQTGRAVREFRGHALGTTRVTFTPDGKQVLTGSEDGTARLWETETGKELLRLIALDGGKDWIVVTPDGLFDGSPGARRLIGWRVPGQRAPVPVDRFFNDFYRPGLLAAIRQGKQPKPEVVLAQNKPPTIQILSPKPGPVGKAQVTIEVAVTDQGGGIAGPWLFQNGSRISLRSIVRRKANTLYRSFSLSLAPGQNQIEVRAACADESWESEPARLLLDFAGEPIHKPDLYFVAIGINKYAEPTFNLKLAASDARALVELFQRRGQALFAEVHLTPLFDEQATRRAIRAAFAQVAKTSKPEDALLVYFAGHGVTVGQRYYFIPHEFTQQAKTVEEDVRQQGYAIDEIGDAVAVIPALKRIMIFDTCHSGAALKLGGRLRNPFAFREAIERLGRAQGIFLLAAAAAGEGAAEVSELGHGILTYTLLAGLKAVDKGPLLDHWVRPDNPEQVVGVQEWFNFASGQVPRLYQRYLGQPQDAQMNAQGEGFPLLPLEVSN